MNTYHVACSDNFSVSLPHRLIEALGQLQAQESNPFWGSVYIYDLVEQCTLCASCSVTAMLGYTEDAIHTMGPAGLADLIHPDDLTSVSEHYQRFTSLESGEVITIDYRMKRADGAWCWLRSQETPLVQAIEGFPRRILGIIQVISKHSMTNPGKLVLSSHLLEQVN